MKLHEGRAATPGPCWAAWGTLRAAEVGGAGGAGVSGRPEPTCACGFPGGGRGEGGAASPAAAGGRASPRGAKGSATPGLSHVV